MTGQGQPFALSTKTRGGNRTEIRVRVGNQSFKNLLTVNRSSTSMLLAQNKTVRLALGAKKAWGAIQTVLLALLRIPKRSGNGIKQSEPSIIFVSVF